MDWTGNSKSIYITLGASNHTDKKRENNDYYATEPKAAELLLQNVSFDKNDYIWECACGEGHLSKVFEKAGYKVLSTDLIDRGYGTGNIDFLACDKKFKGHIITNPPYKYATEFCKHALDILDDGYKVAMFLKIQFLEGKARKRLFEEYPPKMCMFQAVDCCVLKMESLKRCDKVADLPLLMRGLFGKRVSKVIQWLNG